MVAVCPFNFTHLHKSHSSNPLYSEPTNGPTWLLDVLLSLHATCEIVIMVYYKADHATIHSDSITTNYMVNNINYRKMENVLEGKIKKARCIICSHEYNLSH